MGVIGVLVLSETPYLERSRTNSRHSSVVTRHAFERLIPHPSSLIPQPSPVMRSGFLSTAAEPHPLPEEVSIRKRGWLVSAKRA